MRSTFNGNRLRKARIYRELTLTELAELVKKTTITKQSISSYENGKSIPDFKRIREIATIKVLGFYDGETAAYIYRENIILTIVGIIVGLIMGKFLHQYIMTTVEIKSMMFGRVINTKSYIIAAILTVLLSLIVNVVMYYKLKNVKMVESLKSVD